ncbi:hypothetical protein NHX12_006043 [Muraenolepis orangiensis]|uniref:IRF tryptophan pentad repeat domain-containing protein n=1 Tax=Muraenolepis orangiensis TaxID=630683 RepID=A0A9Q0ICI0_9TELE|nr:hypothetical protein NHX12_006043 [Muraenolepis orangiensis]
MKATVTYHRRGEKGTEANVSSASYPIMGKFLEPSTEYLVNVRSYVTFYSESSEDLSFTTPISPSFIAVLVVLSVCVAAVITTSSLFLLSARYKEKWWDSVGKYKDSTLLVMVPGEHKVLKPQNTALCSVYVDPRKVDRDDNEKPWDSSSSGHSSQSAGVDSRSSSLGYSQNVSVDLISSVEDAMRRVFPQIGLPPAEAPWQCAALCNRCYDSVFWTADQPSFENRMYCVAPPPPGIQGQSSVESFYSPSMLRARLHDPGPDSQFLVPIFQLTTQRQLDSSCMNTVFSYRPWNADSGSPSPTDVLPVDVLPVDLAYSSFPRDANWSSDSSGVGSSVSGVSSIGEPGSEGESLPAAPGPSGMAAEHVYGEERKEQSVNAFLALDNDYQDFRSAASRPGVLIQEASGRRTRDAKGPGVFWNLELTRMHKTGRLRLRTWLEEQIESGKYPGVTWLDQTWKANFRCALNSLRDVCELQDRSRKRGPLASRVYRLLLPPWTQFPVGYTARWTGVAAGRANERQAVYPTPTTPSSSTNQNLAEGTTAALKPWGGRSDQEDQRTEAVFKLMDHFNSTELWDQTGEQSGWRACTCRNHWHGNGEDFLHTLYSDRYPCWTESSDIGHNTMTRDTLIGQHPNQ